MPLTLLPIERPELNVPPPGIERPLLYPEYSPPSGVNSAGVGEVLYCSGGNCDNVARLLEVVYGLPGY